MENRFIRFKELIGVVGLSRSTIWRLERRKQFPARRKLSDNSVGWFQNEIEDWMKSKNPCLYFNEDLMGFSSTPPTKLGEA